MNIDNKEVLLENVDARTQQGARLLIMQVQERISHPIFQTKAALTASEIFAHAFGRVVCVENMRYVARKLLELTDPFISVPEQTLAAQLEYLAYNIENNFSVDEAWNKKIHDGIAEVLSVLQKLSKMRYDKVRGTHHLNPPHTIAMQLLEQIA
jgi:hypothetical protein